MRIDENPSPYELFHFFIANFNFHQQKLTWIQSYLFHLLRPGLNHFGNSFPLVYEVTRVPTMRFRSGFDFSLTPTRRTTRRTLYKLNLLMHPL